LKQKVSAFLSRNRRKNRSCQTSAVQQESFFAEITGKQGFWPHKRDKCRIYLVDKFGTYHGSGGRIRLHFFLLRGTQKEIEESTSF
jgi:hypothetical protein